MPARLSILKGRTAKVRITFEGTDDDLNVEYYPSAFTPELEDAWDEATAQGKTTNGLLMFLAELIHSWDLLGNDGEPLGTTPEALRVVPFDVLLAVSRAVQEHLRADPPKRKG